ncbi:hypothetical protein, partial [Rheinheimera faecalis]|uniref:hypothetical protein n=1 Tax=Rheinheimera faecalis TaxID=2901141 RepID=UPI001E6419E7
VAVDAFGNALGNSLVSGLSKPNGYQVGDEITTDGQKGYVAGVDENGEPTAISHSADNLRTERAQHEQWRVDDIEFAMKSTQQQGFFGWSYDSGQSGLINEGLIGGIINDEMQKMRQGLFSNGQNQQGLTSGNNQLASVESDWTKWLGDRSREIQYLGNGLLGAKGLGLASQGYGLGLVAQAKPGGVGSVMQQLGLSQYSSLTVSIDGSRLTQAANSTHYFSFGSTANMANSFGLTDVLNTKPVGWLGSALTFAGPLASGLQALDYSVFQNNGAGHTWENNFGGMASHWAKFGVDSGFAAVSVLGPIGAGTAAVYSVSDLALSVTPQYQIRYGESSGQMVNGWEKAGFYMLDNTQVGINKAVETGVGPRGVKLSPAPDPAPVTPRGRK